MNMSSHSVRLVKVLAGILFVAVFTVAAHAKFIVRSLPELVVQAELVLLATVGTTKDTGSKSGWDYLSTTLEVKKVIKGAIAEKKIEVATRAYPEGKEDHPLLFPDTGAEVIVFLRKKADKDKHFAATWVLSNSHQGIIVKGTPVAGDWDKLLADLARGGK